MDKRSCQSPTTIPGGSEMPVLDADRTATGSTGRCRVLMTMEGGGFFWQSRSIARSLAEEFDLYYVTSDGEHAFPKNGLPPASWHKVSSVTTIENRSPFRKIANLIVGLRETLGVIRQVNPDAVVCVATSLAVPLCLWARLLGIKSVFVESITRVSTPSTTGRVLSRLRLCDRLYVQWPEAKSLYPGAVCKGTVL